MAKVVGIDFGLKRIGIAISDPMARQAFVRPTLHVTHWTEALTPIYDLCRTEEVGRLVVGLPQSLDGTVQTRAVVEDFAKQVNEVTGLPVDFLDERFTSAQADRYLREQPRRQRAKESGKRDQLSAQIILQNYLDSRPQ